MRSDREERIRQRAYALWQSEGHRDGRHEDHWHRAEREIAAEEAGPDEAPRGTSRPRKAASENSAAATPARSRSAGSETRGEKPAAPKKPSIRGRQPAEKG
jgi:Protein of unknown function (DUF2934)